MKREKDKENKITKVQFKTVYKTRKKVKQAKLNRTEKASTHQKTTTT